MFFHRALIALSFFLLATQARAAEPDGSPLAEKKWTVDGAARTALLSAPPAASTQPSPLVFVFHGHGGSARQAARSFDVHRLWPEAIVVYPQGLPTPGAVTDPQGRRNGWQKALGDQDDRDLHFFDAMLKTFRADYKVDDRRVYCTGHSNGGAFTYLLWDARGDTFAAVAPSSAAYRSFSHLKPKPALHVAGEKDPLVGYAMQQRMMAAVRQLNGCAADGQPWPAPAPLIGTLYPSQGGTPFVSLIHPGGHELPAAAPELIVRFFKEHAKPS